ncbi:Cypovirus VP6 [Hubei lepidoptera virus 3]|uniref:Cypovirus VP6 n=1 Tax=Hubei lepidoptera virus 3 TaxID=1922905 RepID=UPI00090A977D|nr:Cypovirus VP6 [Hubei lepidoptera virus 3]APG79098.1 Cypovirus VP6 [Hubei lepidoptera virus 3]
MNRLIAYVEYTESTLKSLEKIKKDVMGLLTKDQLKEESYLEKKKKVQKEIIGGKSSLELLVKPGNVFPLLKDVDSEPLSVLNDFKFIFANQEIDSEIVESTMMEGIMFDDRLDALLEIIILGEKKKEIIGCIHEILIGGENVVVIFEGQNRAIKIRGNVGNEFVVLYFDGTTIFEIDARKELTEALFVGECVNGRRIKKVASDVVYNKGMISIHAYDYVTEKVRQWLITSDERSQSIKICNDILNEEEAEEDKEKRINLSARKVFPDERNVTHGIMKVYKDGSFDNTKIERNMPEFLSLPERYTGYNIVECGIVSVINKDGEEEKESTYIGIYGLIPHGTMMVTEVILIPTYEERVDEQGLVKHVYYNEGDKLRCVERIGIANVETDVMELLRLLDEEIDSKIWRSISSCVQKMDEKGCIMRNKNGKWFLYRAYEIFKNEKGDEIKIIVDVRDIDSVNVMNIICEKFKVYMPFIGDTYDDGDVKGVLTNAFKFGVNVNIRRSCVPRKIMSKEGYKYVSNRSHCMPIFKCGMILQYEDMILLPCGRVTTARNKLLHMHGCTTVRVFDRPSMETTV